MSGGLIRKEQMKGAVRNFAPGQLMDTYDVQWTAASTNPSVGNGTLTGRFVMRGNMCLITVNITFGSSTNGGSGAWSFSLPFTAANNSVSYFGVAQLRDSGNNSYPRIAQVSASGTAISTFIQMDSATNVSSVTATTPFTWATSDSMAFQVEYEVA